MEGRNSLRGDPAKQEGLFDRHRKIASKQGELGNVAQVTPDVDRPALSTGRKIEFEIVATEEQIGLACQFVDNVLRTKPGVEMTHDQIVWFLRDVAV